MNPTKYCDQCNGSGLYKEKYCEPCKGKGAIYPKHEGMAHTLGTAGSWQDLGSGELRGKK